MTEIPLRVLWNWVPGEDDELSAFLRSVKGTGTADVWNLLAESFIDKHGQELLRLGEQLAGFIPAPASGLSEKEHRDHAFYFAEALARSLGKPVLPCLIRAGEQRRQKTLSRSARLAQKGSIRWRDGLGKKDLPDSKHWILVDDILTTGATTRNMALALGLKPSQLRIWVLALRLRDEKGRK